MKIVTIALAFVVMFSSSVVAQDFAKGLAAHEAGDYEAALEEWEPLAEAGKASAQFNLALMYRNGRGVDQDYTKAAKLYRRGC